MQTWQKILTAAAVSLVLAALCFFGGVMYQRKTTRPVEVKRDTVWAERWCHDTIVVSRVLPGSKDTVWLSRTDTLRELVQVEVPITETEYRGEDYRAVVEGFRASLKEIEIRQKVQTITVTERLAAPRWSLGVSAGPMVGFGITPAGWQPVAGAGVIVGVQYRF